MAAADDRTRLPRLVLRLAALGALAFSAATVAGYFLGGGATFCEPGGGCDDVRAWAFRQEIGSFPLAMVLPLLGVTGFTALFAGSLVAHRRTARIIAGLAIAGALVAAVLLWLQAGAVGAWCWLCVGVDSLALVAGGAGVAILLASKGERAEEGDRSLRSPWWGAWMLAALAPIAWSYTLPDPDVPPVIREHYVDGALNVVEVVDFECPYCRALHPVLKSVLERVEGREVNLVRVMLPLAFHTHARGAARAYFCGERMDVREPMADALFSANDLSREGLLAIARELELDGASFEQCLDDPAIERRIVEHEGIAERSNNQGLPTVYIGDRTLLGFDVDAGEAPIQEAVDAALAGEGERVRIFPLGVVALFAIAAAVLGRRR